MTDHDKRLAAEKATAIEVVKRGLAKGWKAKVFYEDGEMAGRYTDDLAAIAADLQATSMETVRFASPPIHEGSKFTYRGVVSFIWGNGPEDVVADFTDSLPIREIVGDTTED